MRWAIIGLIFLGVLAAASAAMLVASYGGSKTREPTKLDIVVATKALPAMNIVDASVVTLRTVSKRELPPAYFTNAVQVVGKMLIAPVAEGQVLTPDCFGDRESGAKLAASISLGMVAVSVSPKDYSSLEGLLYPGCLVDVIFTLRPNGDQQPISKTILQGVTVLAIGQYSVASPMREAEKLSQVRQGESKKVTLQLTPRQAKELQLAMEYGTVSLAMRNPHTPAAADTGSISLSELLGKENVPIVATTAPTSQAATLPPAWNMTLIQGGKKETRSLPLPEEK
jgi:pilus assembly protein CpaB